MSHLVLKPIVGLALAIVIVAGLAPAALAATPECKGKEATIVGSGRIEGTAGPDIIVGSSGDGLRPHTDGADVIYGKGGKDLICGKGGNDRIYGGPGRDRLFGNGRYDSLHGGKAGDLLNGGKASDSLYGGWADDKLLGGVGYGQDMLVGQRGSDLLRGNFFSRPDDAVSFAGDGPVQVDGSQGEATTASGVDRFVRIGRVYGSAKDDTLRGGRNRAYQYDVGIWLNGAAGQDRLVGTDGGESLSGGPGDDTIIANGGHDVLEGGYGLDSLSGRAGRGDDSLDGGPGHDRVETNYERVEGRAPTPGTEDPWFVDLALGVSRHATGTDQLSSIEIFEVPYYSRGNTLLGDDGPNEFAGGRFADVIDGRGGDDTLFARAGADTLTGGDGDDWLNGTSQTVAAIGGDGDDEIVDAAEAEGGPGNDFMMASSWTSGYPVHFKGGADDDVLVGGNRSDTLRGEAGHDGVYGNEGDADSVNGGDGPDRCAGETVTACETVVEDGTDRGFDRRTEWTSGVPWRN